MLLFNYYKDNKLMLIAIILFILFIINIVAGKIILTFNIKQFSVIDVVGEFLLLFITIVFFIFAVLSKEKKSDINNKKQ